MLRLKRHFLNDPVAIGALRKLYKEGKMGSVASFRVGRIYVRVQRELAETGQRAIAIHKKYCKLDVAGSPVGLREGKIEFTKPEDEAIHDKEFDDLLNEEFEEKVMKIPLKDLDGSLLSPEEISSLHPILELPEE